MNTKTNVILPPIPSLAGKKAFVKERVNLLVRAFFKGSSILVGKTTIKVSTNKVIIQVLCYNPKRATTLPAVPINTQDKWNILGRALASVLINSVAYQSSFPVTSYAGQEDGKLETTGNKSMPKANLLEIRLVQLHYPYLDSAILAQYLALNTSKYPFARLQKMVFNKVPLSAKLSEVNDSVIGFPSSFPMTSALPIKDGEHGQEERKQGNKNQDTTFSLRDQLRWSRDVNLPLASQSFNGYLTGVKLELGGRLTTQRSIPRKTVDNAHTGSLSNISPTSFSQHAAKNKLGAYTMKVWLNRSK